MAIFPFKSFRKQALTLADLSDADKRELFGQAERSLAERMPGIKERPFIEARNGVPISRLKDFNSYLEVGSKKVWASFRACHLTANILVSAEMQVLKVNKDGEADGDPLPTNEYPGSLLVSPNPYDSWEEMVYMWTFHMKLTGKAYWMKDESNALGQPKHLFPLLPQFVELVPDRKTKVRHYQYKVSGETLTLKPEEVIEFRRPHPSSLIQGLGDVEAGTDLFQLYMTRNTLEERFLENGAQPSGILTKKDVVEDEDMWTMLKKKFDSAYAGKKNAGKTAFLNGDWTYTKMGLSMQEMQAIERERWTIEQIFLCHGVPLSVAGLESSANYATAKQDEINFRKYECVPLLNLLVGKLNGGRTPDGSPPVNPGLASVFGEDIRFDYRLSGLVDVEQVMKDWAPLVRLGGLTPNELRRHAGMEPVQQPFLDQYFIEQGLVPIEMAGASQPAPEEEAKGIVTGTDLGARAKMLRNRAKGCCR